MFMFICGWPLFIEYSTHTHTLLFPDNCCFRITLLVHSKMFMAEAYIHFLLNIMEFQWQQRKYIILESKLFRYNVNSFVKYWFGQSPSLSDARISLAPNAKTRPAYCPSMHVPAEGYWRTWSRAQRRARTHMPFSGDLMLCENCVRWEVTSPRYECCLCDTWRWVVTHPVTHQMREKRGCSKDGLSPHHSYHSSTRQTSSEISVAAGHLCSFS